MSYYHAIAQGIGIANSIEWLIVQSPGNGRVLIRLSPGNGRVLIRLAMVESIDSPGDGRLFNRLAMVYC